MRTERRTFRPFDVPAPIEEFLKPARLQLGDSAEFVERDSQRVVDAAELKSGDFTIELAETEPAFDGARERAVAAAAEYGEPTIDLVVIVTSPYLKLVDVGLRRPLSELDRVIPLRGSGASAFRAVHHGCDIDVFLLLNTELPEIALRPWRKGSWLSRASFRLRTGLDGLGFTVLPLTPEKRVELGLSPRTLRYAFIDESPLEASSVATVTLYVDSDLLAHLNKTPRRAWAKAFTDQLALDVLTAVTMRSLADPNIDDATWSSVEDKLLGSLLGMVVGTLQGDAEQQYDALLDELRSSPLEFLARIEGALDMRSTGALIRGGEG